VDRLHDGADSGLHRRARDAASRGEVRQRVPVVRSNVRVTRRRDDALDRARARELERRRASRGRRRMRARRTGAAAANEDDARLAKYLVVNAENVAHNARVSARVFTYLSIVSGIAIGALGYTGVRGFAAHGVFMLASACAVAASKCEGRPTSFFPSVDKVFLDGPNAGLPTFVLFWTLSYNCCHLF
jgi:hypothetical protein